MLLSSLSNFALFGKQEWLKVEFQTKVKDPYPQTKGEQTRHAKVLFMLVQACAKARNIKL